MLLLFMFAVLSSFLLECGAVDPGALLRVTMRARIGVVVDDVSTSDAIAGLDDATWVDLAYKLVEFTEYRLVYREFYYPRELDNTTVVAKGALPLPPRAVWNVTLEPGESTTVRDADSNTDALVRWFRYETMIVASSESVAAAEPALDVTGGVWRENFTLPLEPRYLLQRTGYACIDEFEFPEGSVNTDNAHWFYDHKCEAGDQDTLGCHVTVEPKRSCIEALRATQPSQDVSLVFERIPWNEAIAEKYRVLKSPVRSNDVAHPDVAADIFDHKVVYKYIGNDSCPSRVEGCMTGLGWRRLLLVTTGLTNVGNSHLIVGQSTIDSPMLANLNAVKFPCDHVHEEEGLWTDVRFRFYGKAWIEGTRMSKVHRLTASCFEAVRRAANHEKSPLNSIYDCHLWGLDPGWSVDYMAGEPCQWLDVTEEGGMSDSLLYFHGNPEQLLCEGVAEMDEFGLPQYETTPMPADQIPEVFRADGPVYPPKCTRTPEVESNNIASSPVDIPPTGSFVTQPCSLRSFSPYRDCDFTEVQLSTAHTCSPGSTVTLTCTGEVNSPPHVVRICDFSRKLGIGMACSFMDALSRSSNSHVVASGNDIATKVTFTCPEARDVGEPGGVFSVYMAPLDSRDTLSHISCVPVSGASSITSGSTVPRSAAVGIGVGVGIAGMAIGATAATLIMRRKKAEVPATRM